MNWNFLVPHIPKLRILSWSLWILWDSGCYLNSMGRIQNNKMKRNLRPVSLMNVTAKITNKMVDNWIQKHTKRISNHYIRLTGYNTFLGLIPRVSDSAGLGPRPIICISNKLQVMLMLMVEDPHFKKEKRGDIVNFHLLWKALQMSFPFWNGLFHSEILTFSGFPLSIPYLSETILFIASWIQAVRTDKSANHSFLWSQRKFNNLP